MDSKYIEQLLERYWQCETSLEDEAELRAFFSGSDVPKHLLRYKDLFVYQQLQQKCIWVRILMPGACRSGSSGGQGKAPDTGRTLHAAVQSRRSSGSGSFAGKCDAAFILFGCRGSSRNRYYRKQISAPSVALSGDVPVSHEKQVMDSLRRVNKELEIKE